MSIQKNVPNHLKFTQSTQSSMLNFYLVLTKMQSHSNTVDMNSYKVTLSTCLFAEYFIRKLY